MLSESGWLITSLNPGDLGRRYTEVLVCLDSQQDSGEFLFDVKAVRM